MCGDILVSSTGLMWYDSMEPIKVFGRGTIMRKEYMDDEKKDRARTAFMCLALWL